MFLLLGVQWLCKVPPYRQWFKSITNNFIFVSCRTATNNVLRWENEFMAEDNGGRRITMPKCPQRTRHDNQAERKKKIIGSFSAKKKLLCTDHIIYHSINSHENDYKGNVKQKNKEKRIRAATWDGYYVNGGNDDNKTKPTKNFPVNEKTYLGEE